MQNILFPIRMLTCLFLDSVRVTRETAPEAIDKLQRRKLELEVEIHALEREKDEASKERLVTARKAIAQVEEELRPMVAAYENEKSRGDEVNQVRRKIDELKAKADEAERRCVYHFIWSCALDFVTDSKFFVDMTWPQRPTSATTPFPISTRGSSTSSRRRLKRTPKEVVVATPSLPSKSRR